MKCPVCKNVIPDNTLKCPHCQARTGILCKSCNTVNSISNLKCRNCGNEILKACPNCGSINFPQAVKCRKCGTSFVKEEKKAPEKKVETLEYQPALISQTNAYIILEQGILDNSKKIFSLCGEKGIGKNHVLKQTMTRLADYNVSWILGRCTPLTQLTPGGLIQDIILDMFRLPNFCPDTPDFKQDASVLFASEFPELSPSEVEDLLNFIYSSKDGMFEDIFTNKKRTFNMLFKVFNKIVEKNKFVLVADNFDYVDGFSYEFLKNLLKKRSILKNLKFIMLYNNYKPAKGYFNLHNENAFLDICIAPLNDEEMSDFYKKYGEAFSYVNDQEKNEIFAKTKGHPAFLEQAMSLCFDCQIADEPFALPETFEETINARMIKLKDVNPSAYRLLVGATILGDKINLEFLRNLFGYEQDEFSELLEYLKDMNFIAPVNEIYHEFKSFLLWETVLKNAKSDECFIDINKKFASSFNSLVLNSNNILGIIAQNLQQNQLAFDIWAQTTKYAAYIGDVNLYVIAQKQCLALINELEDSDTLNIRYNISERLGKLLSDFNPQEAMEFLPDAVSNARVTENTPKEIELLGYLSYCCTQTGKYYGNIECVDSVLDKISPESRLETVLLKTAKLESLLAIGNCGEVINMIDNDIMPVMDAFLTKPFYSKISSNFVYEAWMRTYLILANALILQGNDRAFEILAILFDIIERNDVDDELFICKCKLALAFAHTIKGDFFNSESILEETHKLYRTTVMDNEAVLRWNLISIINNFLKKNYDGLQEDLFSVVTFANNCGDNFTKNIMKTLLGKIFRDNEQSKHALEIYNEQITYFSKEKIGVGALLTWYLIAEATLTTEGPRNAIDIASQALEVAQNPKINNYLFIILLQTVLVKASIVLADYESAKIHLENAITLADKYNMRDILSRLYLLYGKYFQEIGLTKTSLQTEYLKSAEKMYDRATEIVKRTKNNCVFQDIEKAKDVLKSFCQLNAIEI